MWFARFWHRPTRAGESDGYDDPTRSRAWRDSGLADEVAAFLAGRLVDHLTARGQTVPAWAVLNRLAHADRSELIRFVEGAGVDRMIHPSYAQAPWVAAERFIAGHLLVKAPTPEALVRVQQTALVPVELRLIEQSKIERLTAEQVLNAGAEALDTFHPG